MLSQTHHEALGGILTSGDGPPVVRHYGDAAAEYRSVRESVGVAELRDRVEFRMWGRDPVRMLNGLITNDLSRASEERAVFGVLLTPKGRIISDVRVRIVDTEGGPEVRLDLPVEAVEQVSAHLKKYVPPLFARFERTDRGVIGVYGPRAGALLESVLGPGAAAGEDHVTRFTYRGHEVIAVGSRTGGGETGFDLIAADGALETLWTDLVDGARSIGGGPVGQAALETLRVEAGYPRFGAEIEADRMPAEIFESAGMMDRAISFTKGCYTGQEVVVRIAHRGHVNRHLRGLLLGDAPTPAARTPIHSADATREVGWITSSVASPRMAQTIALAIVRREIEVGAEVRVGAVGAQVVEIPFTITGKSNSNEYQ